MITYLKLKRPSRLICIRLLLTLSGTHPILYHLHFLSGLLQKFCPKYHWLSILLPTQWCFASPTIQILVWCHSYAGMIDIIISEFQQWQHITPSTLVIQHTSPLVIEWFSQTGHRSQDDKLSSFLTKYLMLSTTIAKILM